MEMRYDDALIQELQDRLDIVDVIDSHVKLKKTGKNYSACCPFHEEKSPSFSVEPEKQFYYCFGCGASGNAINFVMNYENLSFPATIRKLAATVDLALPDSPDLTSEQKEEFARKKAAMSLLDRAETYYQEHLEKLPDVKAYIEERGLSPDIVKLFGLGGASHRWADATKRFGGEKNKQALVDAGLAIDKPATADKKAVFYDRFRGGVIFPIRDELGRTISFARRYVEDPAHPAKSGMTSPPKYINGEETACFRKKQAVYGLYESLQADSQPGNMFVLEGYMDVIRHHDSGLTNTVATMGTSITPTAVSRLYRYTPHLTYIFDGDKAGHDAMVRALYASLPAIDDHHSCSFVVLPQGEDPDSLIGKIGIDAYQAFIDKNTTPMSQYLISLSAKGNEALKSIEERAQFFANAKAMLDLMRPSNTKALLMARVQELSGMRPHEYLPYSIDMAEGLVNGVELSTLEQEVKTFIASKISAPEADIKVTWSMPEIAPRRPVDPPAMTHANDKREDIKLRMHEVRRILSFDAAVAPGITLQQLVNTAFNDKSPEQSQVLAKGLLARHLRDTHAFIVECQLINHHMQEIRQSLMATGASLSQGDRHSVARWFEGVSQRTAAIPMLCEFMDQGMSRKTQTLAGEMAEISASIVRWARGAPDIEAGPLHEDSPAAGAAHVTGPTR